MPVFRGLSGNPVLSDWQAAGADRAPVCSNTDQITENNGDGNAYRKTEIIP